MPRTLLAVLFALLVIAAPAHADGNVHVVIDGPGLVDGGGFNCHSPSQAGDVCTVQVFDIPSNDCGPFGDSCPMPGSASATAHAVAGTGFGFGGWSNFCAANATCTVFMPLGPASPTPFTLTATFVDVQAPTVGVAQPADGAAVSGRVTLAPGLADNVGVANVVWRVRGTPLPMLTTDPFQFVFDTQTLPDGPAAITATAADARGNSALSAAHTVTIDNTKPTLTVNGPDGVTLGPGVTPAWTIASADATTGPPVLRCSVVPVGAAPAFGACTSATTERLPNQPDGRYTLTVRTTDRAGNLTEQARTFTVDSGPPDTTITSGPDDGASTDGATITWGFASSEPGSTFECRVFTSTPGPFGPCTSGTQHSASGLAPGSYTFEVRATDAVGNVDATPARRTVTIIDVASVVSDLIAKTPAKITPVPVVNAALTYHYRKLDARATDLDRLVIESVPGGSTVSVECPKGCSKKRFAKKGASGTVSLKLLIKKPLKVKTKITVTVSKPGFITAVKVLEIRARKNPSITTLCLPPGAKRPAACA